MGGHIIIQLSCFSSPPHLRSMNFPCCCCLFVDVHNHPRFFYVVLSFLPSSPPTFCILFLSSISRLPGEFSKQLSCESLDKTNKNPLRKKPIGKLCTVANMRKLGAGSYTCE